MQLGIAIAFYQCRVMAEFEDHTSEQERIQYLRDRGIQIEIPGERRSTDGASNLMGRVCVVRIPCDDREEYEELTVDFDDGQRGDQLIEGLRPFFSSSSTSAFNMEALKATLKEQYGNQDVEVSDSALQKASLMGGVESFPVDHASPENEMHSVKIYLDEASQLKSLPVNRRAAALASACGFKDVPFSGDVFIGRTKMEKDGVLRNVDFKVEDMNSSAKAGAWVKGAESRNYEHNSQLGKVDMSGSSSRDHAEGANVTLGFTFTETLETIDLIFKLPDSMSDLVRPSKQLTVKFNSNKLSVSTVSDSVKLLELNLFDSVDVDGCTWTGSGPRSIEISLEKNESKLWGAVEKV